MARYRPEHKQQTRKRLVESAVTTLRRDGVENANLKEIMGPLGLTVGGFYRHFDSKSALVQAAVEQGLAQSLDRMRKVSASKDLASIEQFSAMYLSDVHKRSLAEGCVLAALSSDLARGDRAVKAVCEQGLRTLHAEVLERLPPGDDEIRDQVWAVIALEVGGLLLARMVAGEDTSADILDSCQRAVKRLLRSDRSPSTRSTRVAKKSRTTRRKAGTRRTPAR